MERFVDPSDVSINLAVADGEEPVESSSPTPSTSIDAADVRVEPACVSRLPLFGSLDNFMQSKLTSLAVRYGAENAATLAARPGGEWLVKGVLPANALALLSGSPGVGKSFIALDLALRLVHGMTWHGRRTRAGSVIYVAAEGSVGLGSRLRAWHQYFGRPYDQAGLLVVDRAVALTDENAGGLANLAQLHAMAAGLEPRLVVLDTLARCTTGVDENSAKEMGQVVASAERLRRVSNCTVLLVHHVGKDASRGPRGSNALLGAVDTSILVTKDDGLLCLRLDKQKEDQAAVVMARLQPVPLGTDRDGDAVSSCVPVEVELDAGRPSPTAQQRLTVKQRSVIELLGMALDNMLSRDELRRQFRKANPTVTRAKDFADTLAQIERRGFVRYAANDMVELVFPALVPPA